MERQINSFIELSEKIADDFDELEDICEILIHTNLRPEHQSQRVLAKNKYIEIQIKIEELKQIVPTKNIYSDDLFINAMIKDYDDIIKRLHKYTNVLSNIFA